jgi:uncharacterized protein (TIGR02118 family)
MDYYIGKHADLVRAKCGTALKSFTVERGLAGFPGQPPRFIAVGHLLFDSAEAFETSCLPVLGDLAADVPNFTNAQPDVMLSEVMA